MPHKEMTWYAPDTELIIAVSTAVGTNVDTVEDILRDRFENHHRYHLNVVRVTSILSEIPGLATRINQSTPYSRLTTYMDAGDEVRARSTSDVLARAAVAEIVASRSDDEPRPRTVHLIRSLKHPDEVRLLRQIYGTGFVLIGVFCAEEKRRSYLIDDKRLAPEQAEQLVERDSNEGVAHGQRTRDTYHLADVFVDITNPDTCKGQLARFLDLQFGSPFITPSIDEYGMYLAFAASLRSADLSRQVGAAVLTPNGECIATGCNDVPRAGGGLYWPGEGDMRDYVKQHDPNRKQRDAIAEEIACSIKEQFPRAPRVDKLKSIIRDSGLAGITEFGRTVHAEMDAVMAAGRLGLSVRCQTIYCTTFPCHNCAKHLVAAGISRLVYIEPYPKSQALQLHADSIVHGGENENAARKVEFVPYIGIGPRRFFDLFSMRHGSSIEKKRAENGEVLAWDSETAHTRLPMWPATYLDRELVVVEKLVGLFPAGGKDEKRGKDGKSKPSRKRNAR